MNEQITLTEAALKHVVAKIKQRGKGLGIRIGTKKTGCSGLAYVLEYVDEVPAEDVVFPINDSLAVYVNPKAFEHLKGTKLDYVKQGLNEGFEFINPNEKGRCGCGESFNA